MTLAKGRPLYASPADIEDDAYRWSYEQAELLRLRRFDEADLPNIVEELESMGREQRRALKSSYRVLIVHMLKWQFQPARRARSWSNTIIRERNNIIDYEEDNRTLRNDAGRIVDDVYRRAARQAAKETKLPVSTFPPDCPYTLEQLRDLDFMPE